MRSSLLLTYIDQNSSVNINHRHDILMVLYRYEIQLFFKKTIKQSNISKKN